MFPHGKVVCDKLVTSCLDHIFIRAGSFSLASYVITKKFADHYIVACRISANESLTMGHKQEGIADSNIRFSFVNKKQFHGLVSGFDWSPLMLNGSPGTAYEHLCQTLKEFQHSITVFVSKKRRTDFC